MPDLHFQLMKTFAILFKLTQKVALKYVLFKHFQNYFFAWFLVKNVIKEWYVEGKIR